jgi:hypothetical protein
MGKAESGIARDRPLPRVPGRHLTLLASQ